MTTSDIVEAGVHVELLWLVSREMAIYEFLITNYNLYCTVGGDSDPSATPARHWATPWIDYQSLHAGLHLTRFQSSLWHECPSSYLQSSVQSEIRVQGNICTPPIPCYRSVYVSYLTFPYLILIYLVQCLTLLCLTISWLLTAYRTLPELTLFYRTYFMIWPYLPLTLRDHIDLIYLALPVLSYPTFLCLNL